jgi:uncharacterized surface protein with fasciclin (FAS1) repeats
MARVAVKVLMKLIASFPAGFEKAFQTEPTWAFTFFAPSNDAFENLGEYYRSFLATPRGKWWFGNQIMSHYVPNTELKSTSFNATETRIQTSTYQYIGVKTSGGSIVLNDVAKVTGPDNNITRVSPLTTAAASNTFAWHLEC